ncbi:hypothetical protein D910_02390 [Dendroctonus ponderosae]|uniref:Uncharacterized protein n=1 Tax=Dendroctonus ponderosae TaxID=77166 RepID=U4TW12_DENPD|nr:hypothetical protein D910_02390 [Dendroctonus ponderosae]
MKFFALFALVLCVCGRSIQQVYAILRFNTIARPIIKPIKCCKFCEFYCTLLWCG